MIVFIHEMKERSEGKNNFSQIESEIVHALLIRNILPTEKTLNFRIRRSQFNQHYIYWRSFHVIALIFLHLLFLPPYCYLAIELGQDVRSLVFIFLLLHFLQSRWGGGWKWNRKEYKIRKWVKQKQKNNLNFPHNNVLCTALILY